MDDTDEQEWEMDEILNHREAGELLEFLVKWKGGSETWELYQFVAQTAALDLYEDIHGRFVLDTIWYPRCR